MPRVCKTTAQSRLSNHDQEHLRRLEHLWDLIRDRTRAAAEGYQNGCYIAGPPGTGKSHIVTTTLEGMPRPWAYRNARMSPMGLYQLLEEHPESTIVLDDIGSLFDQRLALQILLAALNGKPGKPRPVTYTIKTGGQRSSFHFSGAIIAISNIKLRRDPLADAVASRLPLLEHRPSVEQIAAFMRFSASRGYASLTPAQCLDVVEFVIEVSRTNDYLLDLRYMERGWRDYQLVADGRAKCSWQELIISSMQNAFLPAVTSKQDDIERELDTVQKALEDYPKDSKRQIAATGLSRSTFYERKKELESRKNRG